MALLATPPLESASSLRSCFANLAMTTYEEEHASRGCDRVAHGPFTKAVRAASPRRVRPLEDTSASISMAHAHYVVP